MRNWYYSQLYLIADMNLLSQILSYELVYTDDRGTSIIHRKCLNKYHNNSHRIYICTHRYNFSFA